MPDPLAHRSQASPPPTLQHAIRSRIGERKYGMWFEEGAQCELGGGRLSVRTRNEFVRDWITRHFLDVLAEAAREASGGSVDVEVVSSPAAFEVQEGPEGGATREGDLLSADEGERAAADSDRQGAPGAYTGDGAAPLRRHRAGLRPRLDDLIVNGGNALAVHAARAVAEGSTAPAMTLIHGPCGTGKSHLLLAIEAQRRRSPDGAKVRLATAERFTNDYITAIRAGSLDAFRREVRGADLLLVDDLSFLANKNATLMEFLHTIDAVQHGGGRVVATMSSHPTAERRFPPPLVSRLVAGVVAELPPADWDLRRRIAATECSRRGLAVSDATLSLIADHCLGGAREVRGVATRLQALRSLEPAADLNASVATTLARSAPLAPRRIGLDAIVVAAARFFGVAPGEIRSGARRREVVDARGMTALLARELTTLSLPEIARGLGRGAHSTVLQAADRMRRRCEARDLLHCCGESFPAGEIRDRLRIAIARPDESRARRDPQ